MNALDLEAVEVRGLPSMRGLRIRRYRGTEDHDGMAAANGRLYLSTTNGSVLCFGERG